CSSETNQITDKSTDKSKDDSKDKSAAGPVPLDPQKVQSPMFLQKEEELYGDSKDPRSEDGQVYGRVQGQECGWSRTA
ncbi:MAG: hypothetical protein Q9191_008536, partial [Dirinaria sp. TL-2023a]